MKLYIALVSSIVMQIHFLVDETEMFPVCEISLLPAWTNQEVADFQRADTDLEQVITWLQSGSVPQQCTKDSTWQLQSLWTQCKKPAVERWHSLQTVGGYPRRWSRSILAVSYPSYTHTRDHGWVA